MENIEQAKELCNNISDAYNKEYSDAVNSLINYIQILIIETRDKKYNSLENRLNIITFIEDKFNNDIK
jgi:hypothetical protein